MRTFLVHKDPDAVYQGQLLTLAEIEESHGRASWVEIVRELCKTDLWFLLNYVLKLDFLLDSKLHGKVFMSHYERSITGNGGNGEDLLTLVPRTHCKTTTGSGLLIQEILNNPDIAIGIVSGTEKLAKAIAKMMADILTLNPILQECFSDILPSQSNPARNWGMRGYYLPGRKSSRIDPTLAVGSVTSNLTGTHPDILFFEDIVFSRSSADLEASRAAFLDAFGLLSSHSRVLINGTRWTDSDLYEDILTGKYHGNLGPFRTLVLSCWEDQAKQEPIYPKKLRGGGEKLTGFSADDLERHKKRDPAFYNCQYLNDPKPEENQTLRVQDLQLYSPQDLPPHGRAFCVGVEIVGGGVTFPAIFHRCCKNFSLEIPVKEVTPKRGEGKENRILSALALPLSEKRLFIQAWMKDDKHGLANEVRRLGARGYDDIIDSLSMVFLDMSKGVHPAPNQLAHMWIACDLAFRSGEENDYTVFMCVVIDHKDQAWVKDYDRFKERDPIEVAERLIKFYQRMNSDVHESRYNTAKRSRLISSYN